MLRLFFAIPIAFVALAGCASTEPMTREDFLVASRRIYDKPPEKVFEAARQVFELNDSNYTFSYPDDTTMVATRHWWIYMVIWFDSGWFEWTVTAERLGPGSTVHVSTRNSGYGASGDTPEGSAAYDLFYARLEYVMGLRPSWRTCEEQEKLVDAGQSTGGVFEFCDWLADESRPL